MSPDQYSNFEQLFAGETEGEDYKILSIQRDSEIVILAPHGGLIEPGTSEIASSIAGDDCSLYLFEGLRKRPHGDLHITSHKYNEPQAVSMVGESRIVVAIHGRSDKGDAETVWIGGLDAAIGKKVEEELNRCGFPAKIQTEKLGATHPNNICNLGRASAGIQLEVPRSLRDQLQAKPEMLKKFSQAIRQALSIARE